MPWYDYQCEKCGSVFEVQRAMNASGPVRCKECGSTKTSKIFSAAGIQFKGSGFYVTDARGKNAAAAPSAAGDEKPAATAAKPAAEAKPAVADKPASERKSSAKAAKPDAVPAGKGS